MKKRRFRFSLKLALILLTIFALFFAWQSNIASRRRAAYRVLEEVEAVLPKPTGPKWLGNILGEEYLCRIETVGAQHALLTDRHLAILSKVSELKTVCTNRARLGTLIGSFRVADGIGTEGKDALISDAGIQSLSRAMNLESLILFNTVVTDAGVAHLSRLKKLKMLLIASPNITDGSIKSLSKIKSLEKLWVSANISSDGVEQLKESLPNCEIITRDSDDRTFF